MLMHVHSIQLITALYEGVNETVRSNCGLFVSDPLLSPGRSALKYLHSPPVSLNAHQDSKHRPAELLTHEA